MPRKRKTVLSSAPTIKVAAARAQGRRHEAEGTPCQDAVACHAEPGFAVIALADGAGSATHAARGAQLAVGCLVRTVTKDFPKILQSSQEDAKQQIIKPILMSLGRAARRRKAAVADFACTFLFAATDGSTLLVGQLGDGRVGVCDRESGLWRLLLVASKGEFLNETTFVSSENATQNLQLARGAMYETAACILMSDGAEEALFQRSSQSFAPAVSTMTTWVKELPKRQVEASLTNSLKDLIRTKTLDDVSLAILSSCR